MSLCLVVEDRTTQCKTLAGTLRAAGHQTRCAPNGARAVELCHQLRPEIILLDLGLPDSDGLDLIPELLRDSPLSRIVVITGLDRVDVAVAALRAGARHYLVKPWDRDELLLVIDRESRAVDWEELRSRKDQSDLFWGSHPAMTQLREKITKLASSPLTPLLIVGETGTGKEMVVRELHRQTAASGSFVALNCAAVPRDMLESELFGHERGAFTGAVARRRGLVELARDGTLFLDEIGDMEPGLQTKLLRYLEDHRFRRLGGEEELESHCRVVAATHREGDLRSDLFYRLAVVRVALTPLRERREDLLPLTYFVLRRIASNLGRQECQLSPAAERAVVVHSWPGNVRELRNRLEKALVLGDGADIRPEDLELAILDQADVRHGDDIDDPARLLRALSQEGWNVARTARRLGVERHHLRYRMKKYDLRRPSV